MDFFENYINDLTASAVHLEKPVMERMRRDISMARSVGVSMEEQTPYYQQYQAMGSGGPHVTIEQAKFKSAFGGAVPKTWVEAQDLLTRSHYPEWMSFAHTKATKTGKHYEYEFQENFQNMATDFISSLSSPPPRPHSEPGFGLMAPYYRREDRIREAGGEVPILASAEEDIQDKLTYSGEYTSGIPEPGRMITSKPRELLATDYTPWSEAQRQQVNQGFSWQLTGSGWRKIRDPYIRNLAYEHTMRTLYDQLELGYGRPRDIKEMMSTGIAYELAREQYTHPSMLRGPGKPSGGMTTHQLIPFPEFAKKMEMGAVFTTAKYGLQEYGIEMTGLEYMQYRYGKLLPNKGYFPFIGGSDEQLVGWNMARATVDFPDRPDSAYSFTPFGDPQATREFSTYGRFPQQFRGLLERFGLHRPDEGLTDIYPTSQQKRYYAGRGTTFDPTEEMWVPQSREESVAFPDTEFPLGSSQSMVQSALDTLRGRGSQSAFQIQLGRFFGQRGYLPSEPQKWFSNKLKGFIGGAYQDIRLLKESALYAGTVGGGTDLRRTVESPGGITRNPAYGMTQSIINRTIGGLYEGISQAKRLKGAFIGGYKEASWQIEQLERGQHWQRFVGGVVREQSSRELEEYTQEVQAEMADLGYDYDLIPPEITGPEISAAVNLQRITGPEAAERHRMPHTPAGRLSYQVPGQHIDPITGAPMEDPILGQGMFMARRI